jgi:hypothetical protein
MSFWNDLPTYSGPTQFGVHLVDKLGAEEGGGGWVAGLDMNTYKVGSTYFLTNKHYGDPQETVSVYCLSWRLDDTSRVLFETLNDFNYFVTSELSGCRFVVTNYGVAHVAWSAGGHRASGIASQTLRDWAEFQALSYGTHPPTYRRRLSISGTPGILDNALGAINSNNSGQSYDDERAMVFGYRVNGGWAFKVLRYTEAGGSSSGTWSNFACVWAS